MVYALPELGDVVVTIEGHDDNIVTIDFYDGSTKIACPRMSVFRSRHLE